MMGPRAARYRAASIARAAMLYRRALKRGEIAAERTKEIPFCMDMYRYISCPRLGFPDFDLMTPAQVDVRLRPCARNRGT